LNPYKGVTAGRQAVIGLAAGRNTRNKIAERVVIPALGGNLLKLNNGFPNKLGMTKMDPPSLKLRRVKS